MAKYRIYEIEEMTESEVSEAALEHINVKGYEVYFIDLQDRFGYSAIVFCDGRQIKYANDYELHHPNKTRDELREWYITAMNNKLFTEDELRGESKNYDEVLRKLRFLGDYYAYRREHQSIFGDAAEWYEQEKEAGKVIFSPVALGYYHECDCEFVTHMGELADAITLANDPLRDYEHALDAFKYEMWNHEYPINWQGDWDVINCFTKVEYAGDGSEIEQTGWSDEIKKAYYDAAKYVYKNGEW